MGDWGDGMYDVEREFLSSLATNAGAAGVVIGCFYLLCRRLIRKPALVRLTRDQIFRLCRLALVLFWSLVVVAVGGKFWAVTPPNTVDLRGVVLSLDGRPVADVVVVADGGGDRDITDSLGQFRIRARVPGPWTVRASDGDRSAEFTVREGDDERAVRLILRSPHWICGHVVVRDDIAASGAKVSVQGLGISVIADVAGAFRLGVPHAGPWQVTASLGEEEMTVSVEAKTALEPAVAIKLTPEVRLKGNVTSRSGKCLSGAIVSVVGQEGHVVTDTDGFFSLAVPEAESWLLRVTYGQDWTQRTVTKADDPGGLVVVLERQVALSGAVLFTDGAPVAGATVTGAGLSSPAHTRMDGSFRVLGRERDSWELWAEFDGVSGTTSYSLAQLQADRPLRITIKRRDPEVTYFGFRSDRFQKGDHDVTDLEDIVLDIDRLGEQAVDVSMGKLSDRGAGNGITEGNLRSASQYVVAAADRGRLRLRTKDVIEERHPRWPHGAFVTEVKAPEASLAGTKNFLFNYVYTSGSQTRGLMLQPIDNNAFSVDEQGVVTIRKDANTREGIVTAKLTQPFDFKTEFCVRGFFTVRVPENDLPVGFEVSLRDTYSEQVTVIFADAHWYAHSIKLQMQSDRWRTYRFGDREAGLEVRRASLLSRASPDRNYFAIEIRRQTAKISECTVRLAPDPVESDTQPVASRAFLTSRLGEGDTVVHLRLWNPAVVMLYDLEVARLLPE